MHETDLPMVTVIAPCRNEAEFIERAIKSILNNDYPAEKMEILVADGMSDDGTREIVQKMAKKDERIRLLDNPQRIVPSAMNIGIRVACGRYIIRIDCHSTFAHDYISKCVEVSCRTGADNVGGYCATLPGADTAVAQAIAAAASCGFGVGNAMFRLQGPEQEVDTVPFGTYRKNIFDKIGLYDERLIRNQDIELNSRIRKAGGRIVISPEIKLSYYARATYRGLWQQSFNNGLWNPYTIWLVAGGLSLRHFVPMCFVLGLAGLALGGLLWEPTKWMLLGCVVVYLSIAIAFAIRCARQTKVSALLVVLAFVVLHIAYGLGSLWGLATAPFKFPYRRGRLINKPSPDKVT